MTSSHSISVDAVVARVLAEPVDKRLAGLGAIVLTHRQALEWQLPGAPRRASSRYTQGNVARAEQLGRQAAELEGRGAGS